MDMKLELQKALIDLVKGLTSRTFWGVVILTYLYLNNTISLEKYQWAVGLVCGSTQLPKITTIAQAIVDKGTPPAK